MIMNDRIHQHTPDPRRDQMKIHLLYPLVRTRSIALSQYIICEVAWNIPFSALCYIINLGGSKKARDQRPRRKIDVTYPKIIGTVRGATASPRPPKVVIGSL